MGEFYEAFPAYVQGRREAESQAERDAWINRWWKATHASGRIANVNIGDRSQMVTWHGIDVSVSFLFDKYPQLSFAAQWSPTQGRYLAAIRGLPSTHSSTPVVRRNSVILIALNDEARGLIALPSQVHSRVRIEAGGNLVPWLGKDDTPLSEVGVGVATSEIAVVATSRPMGDGPSTADEDEDLVESEPVVYNGELLWMVADEATRWSQTAPAQQTRVTAEATVALLEQSDVGEIADTEFEVAVLGGTVTKEDQAVIRARLADSIAFFRERYDTPLLLFGVNLYGTDHEDQPHCGTAGGDINYWLWCRDWTVTGFTDVRASSETMAHEYFHWLQNHWNQDYNVHGQRTPSWLIEGAAYYSERVYWSHRRLSTYEATYQMRAEQSRGAPQSLSYYEDNWQFEDPNIPRYPLAFLAVTRLVKRSGDPDAWIDFWRPWNSRDRWKVFEELFGITLEDSYVECEAWRAEHYPPHE